MHIPDGFLSPPVLVGCGVVAAAGLGAAVRFGARTLEDREVPLLGVTGAFIFAAQMINVPVAAGTSGHLLGGALLVALVGPHMAAITMTAVVVVQCLLFQDGGLTALGANVLNMALVVPYVAALVLWLTRGRLVFLAAWLSVVVASALAAVELALSGAVPLWTGLTAMVGVHAVIGVIEGLVTVAVLRFLHQVRPGMVRP